MAKAAKPSSAGASPAKSRKPILPGRNSPVDFPKAFRSSGNHWLLKGICGIRRKGYIPDSARVGENKNGN